MSARSRRRRARAEGLPSETAAAVKARRPLRLPVLPSIAAAAGLLLLGAAWTTRLAPGEAQAPATASRFTVELSSDQQRIINSWERFFICHDLLDPAVIDATLQANQRATGSLDFPAEQVVVELPTGRASGPPSPSATGAEEELIAVRRSILDAAVPARLAQVRQQCAGGGTGT